MDCCFVLLILILAAGSASAFCVVPSTESSHVIPSRTGSTALQAASCRRAFLAAAAAASTPLLLPMQASVADDCNENNTNNPCFKGVVHTEWIVNATEPDRRMKLLQDFTFVDSKGTEWTAKKDYELNGANIPRLVWPIFGSPYYGNFRRASVVHDYFCEDVRKYDYDAQAVHDIFYEGMLEDGVPAPKAWIMDRAVRLWNWW